MKAPHLDLKHLQHAFEALGLLVLLLVFKLLGTDPASAFGGWLGRVIGPYLSAHATARRNLERALPGRDHDAILRGMWDHLGRILGEYVHLKTIALKYVQVRGHEHLERAIASGKGALIIGGHFGQWELNAPYFSLHGCEDLNITYRAPNNPYVHWVLNRLRSMGGRIQALPKKRSSGRVMVDILGRGGLIGLLIDQKFNEGLSVPFFGMEAKTNPAFVQFAQKYGASVLPISCRRLDGARFEIVISPPLAVFDDDGAPLPTDDVITAAHALLESWISDAPEQWLWLHKRWPSS